MTVRRLQSGRELVTDAVERQAPTQQVKMGVLIAPYSGGEFAHVQLTDPNRSASGIVRARVLHGVIVDTLPAGTPCTLTVNRGQVQVLGFGGAAVSALAATAPPDPVDPPAATVLWEKFMDTVGFEWSATPEGWSTLFASANTGTSEYLEFTATTIDFWHYVVTGPVATMLLNAVTVIETKFYIPDGETTKVGLGVLGGFYAGWVVYLDPTTGNVYIHDDIQNATPSSNDGALLSFDDVVVTTGAWYNFRVMRAGNVFTAYLDDLNLGTLAVNVSGGTLLDDLGAPDGVNDTFVTSVWWVPHPGYSVRVYRNGLLQNPNTDYTLTYTTKEIVFTTPPLTGDVLLAVYEGRLHGNAGDDGSIGLWVPGVWAREGTARFKDIVGWRLALP